MELACQSSACTFGQRRASTACRIEPGGAARRPSLLSCETVRVGFLTKFAIAVIGSNFLPPVDPATAAPIVPAGQVFACTPTEVWDGDGPIWCAEGPKIRIAGVAAREIDGSCRQGQPCPPVSGTEARDLLVGLLGGPRGRTDDGHVIVRSATMTCISEGSAGGSRTAAWCRSPAVGDLSCAVVRDGGAVPWARFWKEHRC